MLKNYFTIALRNLRKQKGYAFINIIGLAVGIACCILILLFVRDELSYDRFHEHADRLYRVYLEGTVAGSELKAPITPAPMAAALVDEYPEVENATRLFDLSGQTLVRQGDRQFIEENVLFADSTFFALFTVPLLEGDPATALAEPRTLVLTEETARKYFPDGNALGQTLTLGDTTDYRVTGVTKGLPANAHFHFDLLASMTGFGPAENTFWVSNNFRTYVLLQADYDPAALEAKFPDLMRKYAGPQLQQFMGQTYDEFVGSGNRLDYALQAVPAIHLHSHLDFEMEPNGNIAYVYLFSAIALFILLIACINFMNLATARSAGRAKEVGLRKVMGSNRTQLIRQFLSESVLLAFIALAVAVVLVLLLLQPFNGLTGKEIGFGFLAHPLILLTLVGLALGVGLLAGSYPAFFLSSFRPVAVLKGTFHASSAGVWLRRGLVVFQFAISIALIAGTLVVFNQMRYVREKALGLDQEHVVVLKRTNELDQQTEAFKEALRDHPGIIQAASTTTLPGGIFGQTAIRPEGAGSDVNYLASPMAADHDFVETLGIEMAAGRDFDRAFATDSAAFVINEAAARKLGWDDPIGKRLTFLGANQTGEVIGVMTDFHFASLHQEIGPVVVALSADPLPFIAVRIRPDDVASNLAFLEQQWHAFAPDQPFEYSFLDEDFDALYRADRRLGQIFTLFALLAVVIACLGLFGLAAFTAEQRTKEIGVRKVLGASVSSIVLLLSKEFARLVVFALLVAVPIAYFGMDRWLQDFAYRTGIGAWVFVLAGGLALGIALLTVSYHALRAALVDPVRSLRYE
jgi:putative ABC transport system permease protein